MPKINNMILSDKEYEFLKPMEPKVSPSTKPNNKKPRIVIEIPDFATWMRYKNFIDSKITEPYDLAWRLSDKFMRKYGMTHEEQGYYERYPGIWVR
jgi:hypothetical protein